MQGGQFAGSFNDSLIASDTALLDLGFNIPDTERFQAGFSFSMSGDTWRYDVTRSAAEVEQLNYEDGNSFSIGSPTLSIPMQTFLPAQRRWWTYADTLFYAVSVEGQLVPMVSENPGQYDAVTTIEPFKPYELRAPILGEQL